MAAQVHNDILDNGLASLKSSAISIVICSQEPLTFAQANTVYDGTANKYRLGIKSFGPGGVFPSAIANGNPNGRQLSSAPITDGTIDSIGPAAVAATWYAVLDGTRLLMTGILGSSQQVTTNNQFTLGSFTLRLPNQ